MSLRRAVLVSIAVLILAPAAALAQPRTASAWETITVATGGFSIGLPTSWEHATTGDPAAFAQLNAALHRTPAAETRLVAADAARSGLAYMEVVVERPAASSTLQALARQTELAFRQATGLKTPAKLVPTTLSGGKAIAVRATITAGAQRRSVSLYLVYRSGLFYVLSYITSHGQGDTALIERSARSFEILKPPDLSKLVLAPAQLGAGYSLKELKAGHSAFGTTTLDICDQPYPSEALRTGRWQVGYTPPKHGIRASNEVVTYVPGGARQALLELERVVKSCSRRPVVRTSGTGRLTFTTHRLVEHGLPAGSLAIRVGIAAVVGSKHENITVIAIYQVTGDTLSAVYVYPAKGKSQAELERLAVHAAKASALKLRPLKLTA